MNLDELRAKIRDIKDFPTEGILFKDITTLLKDGPAWASVIDHLAARYHTSRVDLVVGVESRGFIFGGALAHQLKAGFVPVRKRGPLPARTDEEEQALASGRTGATGGRATRMRSRRGSGCWCWRICWPPGPRWRPRCDSWSGWARRWW